MGGSMENRYVSVRKKLDELGYREAFGVDSLPLVERLLRDLLNTSEGLKQSLTEASTYKKLSRELEEGVEPFKEENLRLIKENSLLRLAVQKNEEKVQEKIQGCKAKLRDLEAENTDLKLLITEFVERVKKQEVDSLEKTRRLAQLQERNLQAAVIFRDGTKYNLGQRQQMEIDSPAPQLCPHCTRIRNLAQLGKNADPTAIDYLKVADSRIEALTIQNRSLRNSQQDLLELIKSLKKGIEMRETELEKLKENIRFGLPLTKTGSKEFIGGGDHDVDSHPTRELQIALKSAQLQLQILQKRNLNLEKKLQNNLLQVHDDFILSRSNRSLAEKNLYYSIMGSDECLFLPRDNISMEEKLMILEKQLSHCCQEKAKLKALLEDCERTHKKRRGSPDRHLSEKELKESVSEKNVQETVSEKSKQRLADTRKEGLSSKAGVKTTTVSKVSSLKASKAGSAKMTSSQSQKTVTSSKVSATSAYKNVKSKEVELNVGSRESQPFEAHKPEAGEISTTTVRKPGVGSTGTSKSRIDLKSKVSSQQSQSVKDFVTRNLKNKGSRNEGLEEEQIAEAEPVREAPSHVSRLRDHGEAAVKGTSDDEGVLTSEEEFEEEEELEEQADYGEGESEQLRLNEDFVGDEGRGPTEEEFSGNEFSQDEEDSRGISKSRVQSSAHVKETKSKGVSLPSAESSKKSSKRDLGDMKDGPSKPSVGLGRSVTTQSKSAKTIPAKGIKSGTASDLRGASPSKESVGRNASRHKTESRTRSETRGGISSKDLSKKATSTHISQESSTKELSKETSSKKVHDKGASKELHDKTSSKELRERSSSKELRERSSSKELRDRSSSKELRDRSSSKELRDRSSSKELRDRSSSREPEDRASSSGVIAGKGTQEKDSKRNGARREMSPASEKEKKSSRPSSKSKLRHVTEELVEESHELQDSQDSELRRSASHVEIKRSPAQSLLNGLEQQVPASTGGKKPKSMHIESQGSTESLKSMKIHPKPKGRGTLLAQQAKHVKYNKEDYASEEESGASGGEDRAVAGESQGSDVEEAGRSASDHRHRTGVAKSARARGQQDRHDVSDSEGSEVEELHADHAKTSGGGRARLKKQQSIKEDDITGTDATSHDVSRGKDKISDRRAGEDVQDTPGQRADLVSHENNAKQKDGSQARYDGWSSIRLPDGEGLGGSDQLVNDRDDVHHKFPRENIPRDQQGSARLLQRDERVAADHPAQTREGERGGLRRTPSTTRADHVSWTDVSEPGFMRWSAAKLPESKEDTRKEGIRTPESRRPPSAEQGTRGGTRSDIPSVHAETERPDFASQSQASDGWQLPSSVPYESQRDRDQREGASLKSLFRPERSHIQSRHRAAEFDPYGDSIAQGPSTASTRSPYGQFGESRQDQRIPEPRLRDQPAPVLTRTDSRAFDEPYGNSRALRSDRAGVGFDPYQAYSETRPTGRDAKPPPEEERQNTWRRDQRTARLPGPSASIASASDYGPPGYGPYPPTTSTARNDAFSDNSDLYNRIRALERTIDNLQIETNRAKASKADLEQEVMKLRRALAECQEHGRQLATENQKTKIMLEHTEALLKETQRKAAANYVPTQRENQELNQQVRQLMAREMGLEREVASLSATVKALDRDKDEMRVELDRKDEKLARLQNENAQLTDQIRTLQMQLKNAELQLGHTGETARDQEREMMQLKRQLADLRVELDHRIRERDAAQRALNQLTQTSSKTELERKNMTVELERRGKEAEELKRQVQKYIDEVRRIEDLLANKEEELEHLMESYRSLSQEKVMLESQNSLLEREAASVRSDVENVVESTSQLSSQLITKQQVIQTYEQEIEQLSSQVASLENQLKNCQDREKILQMDLKAARDLCLKLESNLDNVRLNAANSESAKNKLQAENNELRTQLDMLESQLGTATESKRKLEDLLAKMREKEYQAEAAMNALKSDKEELSSRLASLQSRMEQVMNEMEKHRLRAAELQNELEKLRRQYNTEKSERDAALAELKRIQAQLSTSSTSLLLTSTLAPSRTPSPSPYAPPPPAVGMLAPPDLSPVMPTSFDQQQQQGQQETVIPSPQSELP